MRRKSRQHRDTYAGESESAKQEIDFSIFDQTRIAVSLRVGEARRVLCGLATFEQDDFLGSVLRVALPESTDTGNAQIILSQSNWKGRIIPDVEYGCDFLFIVDATNGR